MAAQLLDITFCNMPRSWLTRTAPPLWAVSKESVNDLLAAHNWII
jgi:hypothetical protein